MCEAGPSSAGIGCPVGPIAPEEKTRVFLCKLASDSFLPGLAQWQGLQFSYRFEHLQEPKINK